MTKISKLSNSFIIISKPYFYFSKDLILNDQRGFFPPNALAGYTKRKELKEK